MERHAHGGMMGHPCLAFIEAKGAFKHIHYDEWVGDYKPVVSNEVLA